MEFAGWILFGLLVGTVGTLIGAGGGFLMMPVLLFLYKDQRVRLLLLPFHWP